ncbi:oligopeptide transport system permease protein OppB [Vibrio variabilis]|uniref:Oligopeptide transport system permease protein OppB n=1 Tax=Vibrio variabilis TaxID=990271 RepID=A0ABQ0JN86_9VIBR|nr:oligopeptide transport system permease protein OppB [Vibrio variabilis]
MEKLINAVLLLRRLALVVPTFLGVTILIFAITRLVPGGPVERMLANLHSQGDGGSLAISGSNSALSEDQIQELNAFYGLDKPVPQAYWEWLSNLVQLDLGESTRYYEPVSDMIAERIPVSLFYGGMTFFISYFISIPLGYYKALKHGSVFDSLSSVAIFVGYALPGYVVGVLLITLFSYHLEWTPMGGFTSDDYEDFELLSEQVAELCGMPFFR